MCKRQQQLGLALGNQVQLPSQLISYAVDSAKDKSDTPAQNSIAGVTVEGFDMTGTAQDLSDPRGSRCYDGLDMTTTGANITGAGTLLGSKPIRLRKGYYTTTSQSIGRTWRAYATVERSMTTRKGVVSVN